MNELPLGSDPRTNILRQMQAELIGRFGRIERSNDRRCDPMWTLVQGVIGAQTRTAVSDASADALLAEYGSWQAVAEAPLADLTGRLNNQTFPSVAAKRLKACLQTIIATRGSADLRHLSNLPTAEAIDWLEALPGVGRKIAAGVMNTSLFARRAMVIDTHHRRIVQRMGLVPAKADTRRAYDTLMPGMPPEWSAQEMDEHHLLVKTLGQQICRPRAPKCSECPVFPNCETGTARLLAR